MGDHIAVRLTADLNVAFGEEVFLCGSATSLGRWDLKQAPQMEWQEQGVWKAEVLLPCGVRVELKIVVRNQGGLARWLGTGKEQHENISLETTLGRAGAQASRISSGGLPCAMTVEDMELASTQPDAAPSQGAMVMATATPSHAFAAPAHARAQPCNGLGPAMPAESMAVAMLAAQAGAAGHSVTLTTTTTTTTAVVINGCPPQPLGPALAMGPTGPQAAQHTPSGPQPSPAEAPTEAELQALAAARTLNAGVLRAGPVPVTWTRPAREVHICGSWDGWQRPLALEPAPGGIFRLMMVLPPGTYQLKFIVDGVWTTSDELDRTACANRNNVVQAGELLLIPVPLGASNQLALPDAS